MLNLLRMDLYRLMRSKAFYICLGFLLTTVFLCYGMLFLVGTPKGQETAPKIGMGALVETGGDTSILDVMDFIEMIRKSCMDGGAYHLVFGILTAIFVCTDFHSGFVKNIMTLHRKRWKYVSSKLLTMGIADLFYLAVCFGFGAVMNLLFHHMVPFGEWRDILFYLSWAWLINMAFAALIIMLCVFTKNMAAGVSMAVVLSCGLVVMPLAGIAGLFNADGWFPYTLYYNMSSGPSFYSMPADLKVYAVGFVFIIVYTIASVVFVTKQDV